MNKLYVIKIGGSVIKDESQLSEFLDQFKRIDAPKILVHGGGSKATSVAESLGVNVQMTDGRRITGAEMLEVVTMVYGGLINKNLVAQLQNRGCNAIGLTGADADIIHAHRREIADINYGYVGDINSVKTGTLHRFLESGLTPVVAALTHDGQGTMLNTNADTIAATVAGAFSADYHVELLFCFEHNGVLESLKNPASVLSSLSYQDYT
ncbi:MAG: Acetylglutamate kinase [Candidatus Marinimicrobia bacterium]|nr:Acetylglutamate kinase [Candidatus Neomarinimicrobiota bacterium]